MATWRHLQLATTLDSNAWLDTLQSGTPAYAPVHRRYLITNFSLGPGGAERQITETAAGLAASGFADGIFVGEDLSQHPNAGFFVGAVRAARLRVIDLQAYTPTASLDRRFDRLPPPLAGLTRRFAEVIAEYRPEVVYGWQDAGGVAAALAALSVGTPRVVHTVRTLAPPAYVTLGRHDQYLRSIYFYLLRLPNYRLIANSRAVAADYETWLDLPTGALRVNQNSFDWCRRSEPAAVPPIVGFLSRLSSEKRPLLFVEAAGRIARRNPAARFLIVGDGPLRGAVMSRIADLGLEERFDVSGVSCDVGPALSRMTVLVQTSSIEGLPNAVGEAQAIGVPVVATAAGGTSELIVDGTTGHVCANPDPEEIASKVLAVLADAEWRETAARTAAERMAQEFSRAAMIDRTLDAFGWR